MFSPRSLTHARAYAYHPLVAIILVLISASRGLCAETESRHSPFCLLNLSSSPRVQAETSTASTFAPTPEVLLKARSQIAEVEARLETSPVAAVSGPSYKETLLAIEKYEQTRWRHIYKLGASIAYLNLIAPLYAHLDHLRSAGTRNLLTLHFSNFALGVGFIGTVDHLLSSLMPKYRNYNLATTAVLFTVANYWFELSGQYQGYKDWSDFFAGQSGLAAYVAISRTSHHLVNRYYKKTAQLP